MSLTGLQGQVLQQHAAQQGVGLVPHPFLDGYWVDENGQLYQADPTAGTQSIGASLGGVSGTADTGIPNRFYGSGSPTPAMQVPKNLAVEATFLNELDAYRQQQREAYEGQRGLTQELGRVIAGEAPSVARAELGMALGDIERTQLAMAAGAPAATSAYARRGAAANTAAAQMDAAQIAAATRAKEIADARFQQGQIYAQQAQGAGGFYNTTGGLAEGYGRMAAGLSESELKKKADEDNRVYGLGGAALGAAGSVGAAYATRR